MTPTTNLPLQVNTTATAQPATAPATAAPGEQPATTDFLIMLAQLVSAPATKLSGTVTSPGMNLPLVENPDDAPATDATDAAELVAMFSLSLPVAPIAVQPIVTATAGASAVLGMAADVLKDQSAVLTGAVDLPAELTDADPAAVDDSAVSFDSMLAPTTASEAQHAARAAATDAAISRPVHTPVGSAAWADEIGARLTLMAGNGKHTASLRLSPEHLGPLEVRIAISDDRASVWFGAAHADTRAAIENALPRLRELLETQGLSLTDAGVFREPPRDQPTFTTPSSASDGAAGEDASAVVASRIRLGLVDAYA